MYSSCLFCNADLGTNDVVETFPIGRRLAFDAEKGRLWVICRRCARWNLAPIEERWEAIECCERRFRSSRLRYSTDNIGLAQLHEGVDLVRIGRALRPEVAAWRYGIELIRRQSGSLIGAGTQLLRQGVRLINNAASAIAAREPSLRAEEPLIRLRLFRLRHRVLDVAADDHGRRVTLRYGHLDDAELIRPDANEPWRLRVRHDHGLTTLSGDAGLRSASKILAALNASGASTDEVRYATSKIEDAEDESGYFSRIAALAMRTSWGRFPDAPDGPTVAPPVASVAERLALQITNRSFWGRGAIGSDPQTLLLRLPLVDRLALEMAANEDTERRAMEGELAGLAAAWRDAEEIAAIADGLFDDNELSVLRDRLRDGASVSASTPAA
jgi:hypothetical protein